MADVSSNQRLQDDIKASFAATERRAMALAELAARTAGGVPVAALVEEIADVAAVALDADFAVVLEYVPEMKRLAVRAGWGVPAEFLTLDVSAGRTNQAGYTLLTKTPVLSLDTANDPRFGFPEELEPLGLRGALSVLVMARTEVWGVLVVASREARRFAANDLRFLQSAAHIASLTLDRVRMETDRNEMEARLDLALGSVSLGIWEYSVSHDRVWVSPTMERMLGLGPGEFDGRPTSILERVPPEDVEGVVTELALHATTGPEWRHAMRLRIADDTVHWFEISARSVVADDGSVDRVVGVAVDVDERHRADEIRAALMERADVARRTAVEARERLVFLAHLGALLAGQLDQDELASTIVSELLEGFADFCAVELFDEGGKMRTYQRRHVQPHLDEVLTKLQSYDEARGGPLSRATRIGFDQIHSRLYPVVTAAQTAGFATDDVHAALLETLNVTSSIQVPLKARGQLIGRLALGRTGPSPSFDKDDLALAEGIAVRAAIAFDNARLYEERAVVVRALQATLVPPTLPTIRGVDLAAAYRVAEGGIDIGGDFYDAFPLAEPTYAVVIGDVSGKGPSAAAVTGLVRQSLRALAPREDTPSGALAASNGVLIGQVDDTRFCTAVLGYVTPTVLGVNVVVANAGHPRPYLFTADGVASVVAVQGTLLGVVADIELADVRVDLGPGDALVMVTDGVTEARDGGDELGESGLIAGLARCPVGADAQSMADAIVALAVDYSEGTVRDDVAVLVIRANGEPHREGSG